MLAVIQAPIDGALFSGIISVGTTLDTSQVAFVTSVTGSETAFLQIQNIGYWINAVVADAGGGNFEIQYTLLYAKNDSVRKVTGSHLLI